jgi:hypothetical protein
MPPVVLPHQRPIAVTMGVALPQTGPEGTMMMFSVEYEFIQGQPSPEGNVWVIERTHGAPAKLQRKLTRKATIEAAVFGWRPEEGPFHSHFEDRNGNHLSDSIEMQQTGG